MQSNKRRKNEQIPVFLGKENTDDFIRIISKEATFKRLPNSNEFELLRGVIDSSLIILYVTGKLVYQKNEKIRKLIEFLFYEKFKDESTTVGSDEAGKGEIVGPLVTAAVALTPKQAAYLSSVGVTDSKLIPDNRIEMLAKEIIHNCQASSTLSIYPMKFNILLKNYSSKGLGLNDILALAHSIVIRRVVLKLKEKSYSIVIDEFDSSKSKGKIKWIVEKLRAPNVHSFTKAESVPAVASASILARYKYLKWVSKNLSKEELEELRRDPTSYASKVNYSPSLFKLAYFHSSFKNNF
ncbi:MAG: hypothetical protein QXS21_00550 [Thermoproteota archaeon]|nr:hypothetical protein [Candidatus Brockarchaeota archaeon]MBO3800851.1 hypothetical protein [Candidatus Brockarchaeota archaeon]